MNKIVYLLPCVFLLSISLLSPSRAFGGTPRACDATRAHPITICFDETPLTECHCTKEIEPHFRVARLPNALGRRPAYYFTYQLLVNSRPVSDDPVDLFNGKFVLTDDNPAKQAQHLIHIRFAGNASYSIRITVHGEGRKPVTELSPDTTLEDQTLVKALVVGISHYDNLLVPQLFHADSDAQSFGKFVSAILPGRSTTTILRTDDPAHLPTQPNILGALQDLADEKGLCADDWFIFYFSGHGVVGNDGEALIHLLSTSQLDPAHLVKTAIPIDLLLQEVSYIKAGNKLVILDSCFSGSSIDSGSPQYFPGSGQLKSLIPGTRNTAKVQYVFNDAFVPAYSSPTPSLDSGDLMAFTSIPEKEQHNSRHVLYLSAASSTHEAEEGHVHFADDGTLQFSSSRDEAAKPDPLGHSLYTYVLLWNLLVQLPSHASITSVLDGAAPKPHGIGECEINFSDAQTHTEGDILALHERTGIVYQKPEVAGHTRSRLEPLDCTVQIESAHQ